jgi:hypothetical protein
MVLNSTALDDDAGGNNETASSCDEDKLPILAQECEAAQEAS